MPDWWRLNKAQRAALTVEQRQWYGTAQILAADTERASGSDTTVQWALIALADTRLEVARLTANLEERRRLHESAVKSLADAAKEIARLTEARDALMLAKRLTGIEHEQDHQELDQQHEDIRRLVEMLEVVDRCLVDTPKYPHGFCCCGKCGKDMAAARNLLTEMKEKYDARS